MQHLATFGLAVALAASTHAAAQITYVDAVAGGNTTLADGKPFAPVTTAPVGNDNLWTQRAFANSTTIFESNGQTVSGQEDSPMLRTRISGLIPTLPYHVYAYFWCSSQSASNFANWRGHCTVSTSQPSPPLPAYGAIQVANATFTPMTGLGVSSPIGTGQTTLNLTYDAGGLDTSGHFTTKVMLQEGNRWLFEVPLGVFAASVTGTIDVYVDDFSGSGVNSNSRTWFDGVGYDRAAVPFGNDCGAPKAPTIGYRGAPVMLQKFSIDLKGGAASTSCALVVGVSNTTWSGVSLPFDLGKIGLGACPLNVSYDLTVGMATDANGDASLTATVPLGTNFTVYCQWAVFAPKLQVTQGLPVPMRR